MFFLLGVNSQFVRDRLVLLAFIFSWQISASQFIFTRIVATVEDTTVAFFVAGFGGSIGIVSSIYFYKWFSPRFNNWKSGNGFKDYKIKS